MKPLIVTSPALQNRTVLNEKHLGKKGISPELRIEGLSCECQSLALILEEKRSLQKAVPYWIIWNLPPATHIPEHIPAGAVVESLNHAQQGVAKGINQYRGPKKNLIQFKKQKFTLTVYALDTQLDLIFSAEKHHLIREMKGHILQTGEITFAI